jgi:NAD(P)-dependent dehydrogenase (short-subunit alcohol dehydrogenase family)
MRSSTSPATSATRRSSSPWSPPTGTATGAWTCSSTTPALAKEGIKSSALCPGFVDTKMTEFVKGQVSADDMITTQDIAESVRLLLKVSPACIIPEIQFIRPDDDF